jgi:hypothetical protein
MTNSTEEPKPIKDPRQSLITAYASETVQIAATAKMHLV